VSWLVLLAETVPVPGRSTLMVLAVVVVAPSMPVWVVCDGRLMLEPSLPLSVTVWPLVGATVPPPLGRYSVRCQARFRDFPL